MDGARESPCATPLAAASSWYEWPQFGGQVTGVLAVRWRCVLSRRVRYSVSPSSELLRPGSAGAAAVWPHEGNELPGETGRQSQGAAQSGHLPLTGSPTNPQLGQ